MSRAAMLMVMLVCWQVTVAQKSLRGQVLDNASKPVSSAIVKAMEPDEDRRMLAYAISKEDGTFELTWNGASTRVLLSCSLMGFHTVELTCEAGKTDVRVVMLEDDIVLKETVVRAPPVAQHGDTINYNVATLAAPHDRTIEEVIKKIPGMEVEDNGKISYKGESINRFYIEGLDMLGGRYSLVSKNIKPDDIASINVYENHQPKKVLHGIEHSRQAAINLTMKRDRMLRPIISASIGGGYGDKAEWVGDTKILFVSPHQQMLALVKANNAGWLYTGEGDDMTSPALSIPLSAKYRENLQDKGATGLATSRYLDNNNAIASLNLASKTKSEQMWTFSGGYNYQRLALNTETATTYWQAASNTLVIDEREQAREQKHNGWATWRYECNEAQRYIRDVVNLQGSGYRQWADITQQQQTRQQANMGQFSVGNNLDIILRRNQRLYSITSETTFDRVPAHHLQAWNQESDTTLVRQNLSGTRFHNREATSYSWLLGSNSAISLHAVIDVNYESMGLEHPDESSLWNFKGFQLQASVFPAYRLSKDRLRWNLSLPLKMNLHNYSEAGRQPVKYHRPQAGFNSLLHFKMQRNLDWEVEVESNRRVGDLSSVVQAPIYTTYRNWTTPGSGMLSCTDGAQASTRLLYRNTLGGVSLQIDANYGFLHCNVTQGSLVTEHYAIALLQAGTGITHTGNFSAHLSKNILGRGILLKTSLLTNIISTDYSRNGSSFCQQMQRITLRQGMQLPLFDKHVVVDADLRYSYSRQSARNTRLRNSKHDVLPSVKLTILPIKSIEFFLNLQNCNLQNNSGKFDKCMFLDAGAQYKHRRWSIELSGRNLSNTHRFLQRTFAILDTYSTCHYLRSVDGLCTFKYNM